MGILTPPPFPPAFEAAVEFVLEHEGYKSEDPNDPGGRTIWGLSSRSHYQQVQHLWNLDPQEAREQAKAVYLQEYWLPSGCEDLPWPLAIAHFDTSVNLGKSRARRMLTSIPQTAPDATLRYLFARLRHYADLAQNRPTMRVFFRGWAVRVIELWEMISEWHPESDEAA